MIWQRKVRVVLGLAGLGAAAAVYTMMGERTVVPPVTLQPTDREVVAEGVATVSTRAEASFDQARWSSDSFRDYADGSSWYGAIYIDFTVDGVEIWADEALLHAAPPTPGAPRTIDLTGNVRFKTSDGLEVLTPSALYEEATGVITMPGVVEFSKGSLTGHGTGGAYDRHQELFQLKQDTTLSVAPNEDGEFIEATSIAMTFARMEQFLRLESEARIERPSEVLAGDRATLYFIEASEELEQLDLRGRASVTPARGATNPPPEMHGDTIALTFRPDNHALERATLAGNASLISSDDGGQRTIVAPWIDVVTGADGHTVTGLQGREGVTVRLPARDEGPARTITAPQLDATGTDGAGLQQARFEGGVVFTEHASTGASDDDRTVRSGALSLQLDGDLEAIDDAEFRDQVHFVAGDTTADAELANYWEADDLLVLHSVPDQQTRPHVEDDRVSIDADDIALRLDGGRIDASGDVRTHSEPDPSGDDVQQSGLFDSGASAIGRAAEVMYSSDGGHMTYRGSETDPASLLQGDKSLEALVIDIDDETGDLEATGAVVSTFVLEDPDEPDAAAVSYEIRADSLVYDGQTRVATYEGQEAPVRMTSTLGETEADLVVLTLAEADGQIDGLEWTGHVKALFEKENEAVGDSLEYEAATGRYVLRGLPAMTKFPNDDGTGCTKMTGQYSVFNRRTGDASWPTSENRLVLNDEWDCGKSIR